MADISNTNNTTPVLHISYCDWNSNKAAQTKLILKSNRLCSFMNTLYAINPHPTQFWLCFKIIKYIRKNLPITKKFKYPWVVYHSHDVEADGITYQSQACAHRTSDVQKCMYFKHMVQRDRPLKSPSSCNAIFLIRSSCNAVLPDMLLSLSLTPVLD